VLVIAGVRLVPPLSSAMVWRSLWKKQGRSPKENQGSISELRENANTCPKCKTIYGDFYLHDEPGAPFFPESEEDAKSLYVTEIPLTSAVQIQGAPGVGVGELILQHAKRI
jgi:hypothetical protein